MSQTFYLTQLKQVQREGHLNMYLIEKQKLIYNYENY